MPRLIRWKGLVPFALVIAAVCAFNALFLDSMLKNAVRSAVEDLVGAEVEIDDFDFQLLNAALVSEGIRAADKNNPAKNLFEIERLQLDFDANFLSRKKIVADSIVVKGFKPGTGRIKGLKPVTRPGAEAAKEKGKAFDFSGFVDKLDIKKLADELNIPVIKEAKALDALIKEKRKYWKKNIAEISDTRELKKLLARIKKIDLKSYKSLKDLPRLQEDIKLIRKAREKIDERIKDAQKTRRAFKKDRRILEAKFRGIKKMSSQGMSSMLLPGASGKELARNFLNAVLDDTFAARGFYFLDLYEKYKGLIPEKKKRAVSKTGAGIDADFIKAGDTPMFYAKKIAFSGERNGVGLSGDIHGLSSDLSWRPIDFDLIYMEKQTPFRVKGRLEMKNQKFSGQIQSNIRKFSFDRLDVSGSNILTGVKGAGNIVFGLEDTEEKLTLNMSVAAIGGVSFLLKTDKMDAETKDILNKAFTDLENLSLFARFEKSGEKTDYSMKSSIYQLIGGRLSQILAKRFNKAVKDAKVLAKRRLSKNLITLKKQLAGLVGGDLDKTLKDLRPAQKKLGVQQAELNEKLKKAAEDKVDELLKLFK